MNRKTRLTRWLCIAAAGLLLTACQPAESTPASSVSSAAEPTVQPATPAPDSSEVPEPAAPTPGVDQKEENNSTQAAETPVPTHDAEAVELPVIEITSTPQEPVDAEPQPTIAPEEQPVETPAPDENQEPAEEPVPELPLPGGDDGVIELPIIPVN